MCHKYIKAAIANIDLDTVDKDSGVLAKVPYFLPVLWNRNYLFLIEALKL